MRFFKKVLVALLLAGLVMLVVAPLGTPVAQETSRNLKDLLPLNFTIGDVKISWHQGKEPLGVFQEGDYMKLVWDAVIQGPWILTGFMEDYVDVIRFGSGGSFIAAYRDRENLGTVVIENIDLVEEVYIPKKILKEIPTPPVSGFYLMGTSLGGDYTPKDFDLSLLQSLGITQDNGCRWYKGNYYWNPQSSATVDQVAAWLGWMFGKKANQANPGWKENQQAAARYYADLGYEYFGPTTAVSSYPMTYHSATYDPFKMFVGIDRALWAGIVKPEELTNQPITRAQFALLACRAFKIPLGPVDSKLPWDLKDPQWKDYLPAIQALLSRGFLKLFPDGSFYPEGTITREEAVKILYAMKVNDSSSIPVPTITPTRSQTILDFPVQSSFFYSSFFYKNGQEVRMDTTPTIVAGRTFLPIRYVAETLGAKVEWNQEEQKVTITTTQPFVKLDGTVTTTTATTVELWIGKPLARVNGVDTPIDPNNPTVVPFILPPGRTMLPLRFIAETLGAKVYWLQETQEVLVIWEPPAPAKEKSLPPP